MPEKALVDARLAKFKEKGIIFLKQNIIYFKKSRESLYLLEQKVRSQCFAEKQKFTDDPE